MNTTKAAILIAAAFVIANLLSCTLTSNPDGSFSAAVDPTTAAAIATKIIAEK
jgi:hypothetical protein